MKNRQKIISFLLLAPMSAHAFSNAGSLGDISDKLMLPLSMLTSGLYNVSLAIGIGLLFGGLIQYKNYRNNPSQVPMSRFVTLLVFGLVLVCLPFIVKLSQSATLFSS